MHNTRTPRLVSLTQCLIHKDVSQTHSKALYSRCVFGGFSPRNPAKNTMERRIY